MAIKRSNVISVNLTHRNVMFLQNLGYLNRKKKSTYRLNISEFVNRCIDSFLRIERPEQNKELAARLIMSNITELQKKRDKIEVEICKAARDLTLARAKHEAVEPEVIGLTAEKPITVMQGEGY